jgi:DNA primase
MSSIDEIKARIDVVDLVSESVKLRRSGKNYTGFCPFHSNTRTPAFVVFPESGLWRCFGACNEGGDVFRFMMKKEGWDFPQALKYLADKAGVILQPLTPEKQAADEEFERQRMLLEEAATFFRYHLTSTPAGKAAQSYLEKRGLSAATMDAFGLGYAPDGWDALIRHFGQKQTAQKDLVEAGLVTEREGGGIYDRFRNRILIPIRDEQGRMTGFGARILNPEDQPKFLNSPQTALFDKGRLLFGLDRARKAIRAQDQVVIVEGYLDVIALHQAGFANAVSPMGTALTEDQLRLLKRFTHRIVLALDADAAGQKATLRGLEVARQAMDHTTEISFDPRGLVRHEGRLQADLRVTTLPEGKDPDDVVLQDPEAWRKIVADARPVVIHVMETLAAGQDVDDPKVKNDIAAQVLPLINDVGSPIERDAYRQRLARLLRVDERVLLGVVAGGGAVGPGTQRRRPVMRAPAKEKTLIAPQRAARALERLCLQLLLRDPERLHLLDRLLQKGGLARFTPQDFEEAGNQILARLLAQSLEQDELEAEQYILENLPEAVEDLYREYMAPIPQGEPGSEEGFTQLFRTLLRLREDRIRENLDQIRAFTLEAQGEAEVLADFNSQRIVEYNTALIRIDKARKQQVLAD